MPAEAWTQAGWRIWCPTAAPGCGGGQAASVRAAQTHAHAAGAVKLMIVGPFSSSSTLRHVSVLPRPSRAILLLIGFFPCHSADATLDWTALDQWQASVCPGGGSEGHRRGNGGSCSESKLPHSASLSAHRPTLQHIWTTRVTGLCAWSSHVPP